MRIGAEDRFMFSSIGRLIAPLIAWSALAAIRALSLGTRVEA
jgi:hypothetical protein